MNTPIKVPISNQPLIEAFPAEPELILILSLKPQKTKAPISNFLIDFFYLLSTTTLTTTYIGFTKALFFTFLSVKTLSAKRLAFFVF